MSQPFDILTAPQFDRDVKRLRKKYRRIGEDLRALLQEFEALGVHGELMIGYGRELRKVRLTNRPRIAESRVASAHCMLRRTIPPYD
ncbi:MAG: hypothetical protein F4X87_07940 [Chloroflexi bacterium]|nr:hypothetical protein [Chloroflexota bacterium]